MRDLIINLTGPGGLIRVRSIAFLAMLFITGYLFIDSASIPKELWELDLIYGSYYFITRAREII